MTWIVDILYSFCALIDKVVYWFIEQLISLFDTLATLKIFENEQLQVLTNRIFFLIAIIMIFKVSFSLIQFIIKPDDFNNNERGMGNIVKTILIVLVSLAGAQTVFKTAYDIQDLIIEKNIIPMLVLGQKGGTSDDENQEYLGQEKTKRQIPFLLFSAFVRPNLTISDVFDYKPDGDGYLCDGEPLYESSGENLGEYNLEFGRCVAKHSYTDKTFTYRDKSGTYHAGSTNITEIFRSAYENYEYGVLADLTTLKYSTNREVYILDYRFLISTAAGVFVVIMYLNFCIDLAIRVAKMGFLQLIAPIPIISMIDPKSSKSGMMSKYLKECISTYLGLFIRIAAVSFVVLVVGLIFSSQHYRPGTESGIFVQLVVLFGALMFAKDLPKLISDLTGVDLQGNFRLNPFQRVTENPVAGRAIGMLGAGAVGGVAGVASAIATGNQLNHGAGRIAREAVGGFFRGAGGGIRAGVGNDRQHMLRNGLNSGQRVGQRLQRNEGSTFGGRTISSIQQHLGMRTQHEREDEEIKGLQEFEKFKGDLKSLADFDTTDLDNARFFGMDANLQASLQGIADYGYGSNGEKFDVKSLKEYLEDLRGSGASQAQVTAARNAYEAAQKFIITNANDTAVNNERIQNVKSQMANYVTTNRLTFANANGNPINITATSSYSDISDATNSAQTQVNRINTRLATDRHGDQFNVYTRNQRNDEAARGGNNGGGNH